MVQSNYSQIKEGVTSTAMKSNAKLYSKTIGVLHLELQEALETLSANSQAAAHIKAAITALTDLLPPPLIPDPPQTKPGADIQGASATQDTMLIPADQKLQP
jgi:hypothetical protein